VKRLRRQHRIVPGQQPRGAQSDGFVGLGHKIARHLQPKPRPVRTDSASAAASRTAG
jgi:hypothetical protein